MVRVQTSLWQVRIYNISLTHYSSNRKFRLVHFWCYLVKSCIWIPCVSWFTNSYVSRSRAWCNNLYRRFTEKMCVALLYIGTRYVTHLGDWGRQIRRIINCTMLPSQWILANEGFHSGKIPILWKISLIKISSINPMLTSVLKIGPDRPVRPVGPRTGHGSGPVLCYSWPG